MTSESFEAPALRNRFDVLRSVLFLLLIVTVVIDFTSNPAFAAVNGLEEIGHSFQSDMRGGTEVAIGDTGLSQIRQPAAPALHERGRFDSKMTFTYPIFKSRLSLDESTDTSVGPPNFSLGYVRPVTERLGIGVSVYSKMSGSARFSNQYFSVPGKKQVTSTSMSNYAVAVALAYKVTPKLLVGFAPRMEMLTLKSGDIISGSKVDFGGDTTYGAGFSLGVLYKPTETTMLGASYRSNGWMRTLESSSRVLTNGVPPINGNLAVKLGTVPQRLSFGASWQARKNWKLATEAGWISYRQGLTGHDDLRGLVNMGITPGYKDVWLIDVGTDYEINENLGVSCGYSFNTSPIRKNLVNPIWASTNQNSITYGLRVKKGRLWGGIAHIIGLPSSARNHGVSPLPNTPELANARVNQVIQSLTFGVGCYIF